MRRSTDRVVHNNKLGGNVTELIAVREGLKLFAAGGVGVIVDADSLDVYDPAPVSELLSQDGWVTAATSDKAMVASVHLDLAETQLHAYEPANTGRTFRVPKNVRETASQGLAWRDDPAMPTGGTPYGVGIARKLSSGTVTADTVSKMVEFHNKNADANIAVTADGRPNASSIAHALWGANEGAQWARRIHSVLYSSPVVAAAAQIVSDDEPFIDPTQPHAFKVFSEGEASCAFCGGVENDEIHVINSGVSTEDDAEDEDASGAIKYFALLDAGSSSTTFVCLGLYASDRGGWFIREDTEWLPTEAPEPVGDLALLDDESFQALIAQVDDPTTGTLELSISESRLAELALGDLDLDLLDALFAQVPYVDPQIRSRNASKQVRDSEGRFIQVGGRLKTSAGSSGTVVSVNDNDTVDIRTANGIETVPASAVKSDEGSNVPKARLKTPGTLVPDIGARLERYAQENAGSQEPIEEEFAVGSADGASTPADIVSPLATQVDDATTPGGSTVTPLYLAVVDANDTQAVLDLVAVIPAESGGTLEAYRRDGGQWVNGSDILADLQGTTPPPVVELDKATLDDVLSQMDAGGIAASGQIAIFSLTAAGTLVREYVDAPTQLASYDIQPFPRNLVGHLDQLAGGADRNRGNAERLRRYWTVGEGGAKIRWNTDGDWTRCEHELSKHLGERAKGYCSLRHREMTGRWPGDTGPPGPNFETLGTVDQMPKLETLLGEFDMAEIIAGSGDEGASLDVHMFVSSEIDPSICAECDLLETDAVHKVVPVDDVPTEDTPSAEAPSDNLPSDAPADNPADDPNDPYWAEPHPYEDGATEGPDCVCGKPEDDVVHTVQVEAPTPADEDPNPKDMPSLSAGGTNVDGEKGVAFKIPVVLPEGKESGDGRSFTIGALSSRDMPLALLWQIMTDEGHKQSVIVGRLDHVEQIEGGGLGNAYGVFDTGEYAQEALRLVRGGMLRGISADLDMFEANLAASDESDVADKVTAQKMEITSARLMAVTLVAKPAFAECVIQLEDGDDPAVTDGIYSERSNESVIAALTAAAAPLHPPKDWFENPSLQKPTHLTVTDDGRVFGHIAAWDVNHIGLPYAQKPPRSASNYAYFRTGALRTIEGDNVRVGQLTLWGGHASMQADARTAVQHYDDTNSAVADLAAGEDQHGIWVSGALRPGVTPEQVRALRASSPSGDWRPIKGMLELVAVCQVNVPGFPIAQSMVASGQVTALVAAGIAPLIAERHERELGIKDQLAFIESAVSSLLADRAAAAAARVKPIQAERRASLTASATSASERIARIKAERDAELNAKADRAKSVIASLRVEPDFEEAAHPRDDEGKFRTVLGRLKEMFNGPDAGPAAAEGLNHLEDAADKEDAGDQEGADAAASSAVESLENAAQDAVGDAKAQLEEGAEDLRHAVARLNDVPDADGTTFDELPQEIRDLLLDAVDKLEQQLNPADPDKLFQQVKGFITGTNPMSATDILNFLKRQAEQETTNKFVP